jgi:DNA-binding NarL/FixJ family response regulator
MTQPLVNDCFISRNVRIVVADDQPRARHALRTLLSLAGWDTVDQVHVTVEVVGEAANGQEVVAHVARLHPDVVLMDARMPVMNGFEAAHQIKKLWPAVRVVMLTMHPGGRTEALAMGVDAYLLKGCTLRELLEAIAGPDRPEPVSGNDARPCVFKAGTPAAESE